MSTVATGMANNSTPSFLAANASSTLLGVLTQQNTGVITNIILNPPLVLTTPFSPGGTAVAMNLALLPTGSPVTAVGLRINFYNAAGSIIGIKDFA